MARIHFFLGEILIYLGASLPMLRVAVINAL